MASASETARRRTSVERGASGRCGIWALSFELLLMLAFFASGPGTDALPLKSADATQPPRVGDQALVDSALIGEKSLLKEFRRRSPLVETYVQTVRADEGLGRVPVSDDYALEHLDLGKAPFPSATPSAARNSPAAIAAENSIQKVTRALHLEAAFARRPLGFLELASPDPAAFNRRTYLFRYTRREFLGTVPTRVYDVTPRVPQNGRFQGRIWIEDQDGFIVRFSGTVLTGIGTSSPPQAIHFDSWRMNLQPGIWLPVGIYVEEEPGSDAAHASGLLAQIHFWGYGLGVTAHDNEKTSMKVEYAQDSSPETEDVSPLQAQREWATQAEDNVLDRMEKAGLLASRSGSGGLDEILDQLVINLAVPNNLTFSSSIHCRVILTDTLEATTVGNTILVSKGLLDTMPNEATFASVIALELANIALGNPVSTIDAFRDRLLFASNLALGQIHLSHSDRDLEAAQRRAMEYLRASVYKDQLPQAGLFWKELAIRSKALHALTTPVFGDSLLRPDGTPWLSDLAAVAPKIDPGDPSQTAALPLGSWVKTDPWTDSVHMLVAKRYAPMNARENSPLEITPIYYNLQRYESAALVLRNQDRLAYQPPGEGGPKKGVGTSSAPHPHPPETPGSEGGTPGVQPKPNPN